MAVIETLTKRVFRMKLDNGTDDKGNVKTVNNTFPTLSISGWDMDKAMAISNAVRPCLSHTVYSHELVDTKDVEEE